MTAPADPEPTESGAARPRLEVLRLLLLQVAVLSLLLTVAMGSRQEEAGPALRVVACVFAASVEVLTLLSLRTRLVRRMAVAVFLGFAVWSGLRGLPDLAATAIGAAALGLLLARFRPPVEPSGGAEEGNDERTS